MVLDDRIDEIRADFPYLDEEKVGKKIIYFDNSATTQKPMSVIDAVSDYYKYSNANPHRGAHFLTEKATILYEESREKVRKFINAEHDSEIIFTRNATESLNLIMYSYALNNLKKGDEIIMTILDHHSDFVTWQYVSEKTGAKINIVHLDDDYGLDMEEYQSYLNENTKIVCFSAASNVTSYVPDVKKMVSMAHEKGAIVIVDGAQSVPHSKTDVRDIDADFLVFSGHKMLSPMGIGVLYGKKKLLDKMSPFLYGGDMIEYVYEDHSTFANSPQKFEAGTQNVGGAVGLAKAIDYIEKIGIEKIHERERTLTDYAYEKMLEKKYIDMYFPKKKEHRGVNIAFNIKDIHPHDVATILDSFNIAVRSGHHCAMPLHSCLNINASSRCSFAFYNTVEEIDFFISHLDKVREIFGYAD